MVKTYGTLYLEAKRALQAEDGMFAANIARTLLAAAAEKSVERVLADRDLYASEEICRRMASYVARRTAGEPVAYILNTCEFYGMHLFVDANVLIPREDTIAVTDLAIRAAKKFEKPRILDLCTGSGCIGLAVAQHVSEARVTLADVSKAALQIAQKNVQRLLLGDRVVCVQADALQPATFLGTYDVIVSNPPYITDQEMTELDRSVADFEPYLALRGGKDGLDFYRAILEHYTPNLKPGGFFCFEFGFGQHDAVAAILQKYGYQNIEQTKDTQEIIRAVIAQKTDEEG